MIIRGINELGFRTVKADKTPINSMMDDEEDYFKDKVKDDTKLLKFYSIELIQY